MKYRDYKVEILKYIIPYFRQNTDIKNILLAIGMRFNALQDIIVELLDNLTISKAHGFLLDNIGKEVGTERDEVNYGDYFCVNLPHINVTKRFMASNLNPESVIILEDAEFIQKIMAVIGGNMSSGTRNENLNIIKMITNAEKVVIKQPLIFNKNAFTVVGNPTITDDGIASGFSVKDYIKTSNVSGLSKITESLKFTSNFVYNTLSSEQTIWNKNLNFDLRLVNSSIILRTYDGSKSNSFSIPQSQHKVANGEQVFCDVVITPNLCRIKINGVEYTKEQVTDFSYLINAKNKSFLIGMSNAFNFYFHTSIDLKTFSITVDDKVVYNGSKKDACKLNLYLTGKDITYTKNTLNYIQNILGNGIFLNEVYINV